MSLPLLYFLAAVIAYLLGCFNGSVLISKTLLKDDVRQHGSGNAGLTNFYRVAGNSKETLWVILIDVIKMVAAVLIAVALIGNIGHGSSDTAKCWAGLFCLLGHNYPCYFHFKGGKGILSGGVLTIMVDWRVALVAWLGFIILVLLTKYVSLGSLWAAASYPVSCIFVFHDIVIFILALLSGALIIWGHRGNIKRLIQGKENKFTFQRHKRE